MASVGFLGSRRLRACPTSSRLLGILLVLLSLLPIPAASSPGRDGSGEITPEELRDAFFHRALEYIERFRKDDLGQASRICSQILRNHPDFAPASGALAQARAIQYLWGWNPSRKDLEETLQMAEEAVEQGPNLVETHLGLGLALLASERYTPALAELDRAVAIDPDSFRAHLYRGILFKGLRRQQDLRQEAEKAISLSPSSPLGIALRGDAYQETRDFPAARRLYLASVQLDQSILWPRVGLAAAYEKEGEHGGALKTFALSERDFPDDLVWFRILGAAVFIGTQDYDSALEVYDSVADRVEISPPILRRLMQAGKAHALEKLGRGEEAEYYWNRLLEELPADFDGAVRDREMVSQAYEGLVRFYENKGETRRAETLLQKACSSPGRSFSLCVDLAKREQARQRLDRAVSTFRRGLAGSPENLDLVTATQAFLPLLRAVATGKASRATREESMQILRELAARLDRSEPTSYVPYLNLARAEALLGESEKALDLLERSVARGFPGIGDAAGDPDLKSLTGTPAFRRLLPAQPSEN